MPAPAPSSRPRSARPAKSSPIVVFAGVGLLFLAVPLVRPFAPQLVFNASASLPIGYYRRADDHKPLAKGDIVYVRTPLAVRDLADTRRYLPRTVPMIKRVSALTGDTVCARGTHVFVNDEAPVERLNADRLGRPLPWWQGCRRLTSDEVFLMNANAPLSFDGRYFGVVKKALIVEKLKPL